MTDGFNPVDIVNPKQYFDPLHSRKKGVLSLLVSESLPLFDYDFLYIPTNPGGSMPGEESRWLPREVFIPLDSANNTVLLLPESLRNHYGTTTDLDNARDNNFALRLQKHLGPVTLNLKNDRTRQGGFTFVSSQWDFLFKYETSYSQSVDDDSLAPGF